LGAIGVNRAPDSLLRVEDLHVRFSSSRGIARAIDGVSFALREGESLGIVGESGSGKSVLVRTIAGLTMTEPGATVDGKVWLEDYELVMLTARQRRLRIDTRLAMVFQNPLTALNPVMRVGEQIAEPLRVHLALGRSVANERAIELLRQVRIPEPERRVREYPHMLSGGMRQRVGIAIALACQPRLLIADEPTTALDVTVQKQILDLLGSLRSSTSLSMILISHDLGVVAGRTERVAVMYAGRIVELGDTKALFANPQHPYTAALLAAIPRITYPTGTRLQPIEGQPPDPVAIPRGCAFAPRCTHAQERCWHEVPHLSSGPRSVACHFPLTR
jgi:peptide/nickel transport system ATP-binding protein